MALFFLLLLLFVWGFVGFLVLFLLLKVEERQLGQLGKVLSV